MSGDDPTREVREVPLADPELLGRALRPAERWLVVVDFDGTLAPIVDHPDLATPAPGALAALRALIDATAVAVVSGRPVADVRRRLEDLPIAYAGGHGAELLLGDGRSAPLVDPAAVADTLDAAERELRTLVDDEPGWLVERKAASLAVHHRLANEDSVDTYAPRVQALLARRRQEAPGFDVLTGKAVVEMRATGADKGAALERIATEASGRTPLVLGDDMTDEDAFRVARSRHGRAILVSEVARPTLATDRISDPAAVVRLLAALAG